MAGTGCERAVDGGVRYCIVLENTLFSLEIDADNCEADFITEAAGAAAVTDVTVEVDDVQDEASTRTEFHGVTTSLSTAEPG